MNQMLIGRWSFSITATSDIYQIHAKLTRPHGHSRIQLYNPFIQRGESAWHEQSKQFKQVHRTNEQGSGSKMQPTAKDHKQATKTTYQHQDGIMPFTKQSEFKHSHCEVVITALSLPRALLFIYLAQLL
jgi:hypothetical protein